MVTRDRFYTTMLGNGQPARDRDSRIYFQKYTDKVDLLLDLPLGVYNAVGRTRYIRTLISASCI
jgi:hypothetical protein